MLNKVISEISDFLDFKDVSLGEPYFSDSRYSPFSLSKNNFHKIPEKDFAGKVCFIDGGNLELVSAPNFSIHLIRINYSIYKNNKRLINKLPKLEFFSVSKAVFDNGIKYSTKLIPLKEGNEKYLIEDQFFDPSEYSISVSGQYARRMMEWHYLNYIIHEELSENDLIVMDGTLQTSIPNESKYISEVFKNCIQKNIYLTALAKTSRLYTTTGFPLLYAVNSISPDGKWYYHPIVKNEHPDHRADIYIVKLHENSDYSFRFEINKDQKFDESILSVLSENSQDSSFLGYPYGLIFTDKQAKIYKHEKNAYLSFLYPKLSNLKKFITSINAHALLDAV